MLRRPQGKNVLSLQFYLHPPFPPGLSLGSFCRKTSHIVSSNYSPQNRAVFPCEKLPKPAFIHLPNITGCVSSFFFFGFQV